MRRGKRKGEEEKIGKELRREGREGEEERREDGWNRIKSSAGGEEASGLWEYRSKIDQFSFGFS